MKEEITPMDLKEFSEIVDIKLQPSPINLEAHKIRAEADPVVQERLETMLDCCFEYTKDVAHHEHLQRSGAEFYSQVATADHKRTETHNATITAIIAYREILDSKGWLNQEQEKLEIIPEESAPRGRFGKFALLLTLNRFKDQIILVKKFSREGTAIDYDKLRKLTETEQDLLVIEYVQTVSHIYEQEDLTTAPEAELEAKLHEIEARLGLDEETIFHNFITIYEKGYRE